MICFFLILYIIISIVLFAVKILRELKDYFKLYNKCIRIVARDMPKSEVNQKRWHWFLFNV